MSNKLYTPSDLLTNSDQPNMNSYVIFKDPNTNHINDLISEIDSLDSVKREHKRSKNFIEADLADTKLRELKSELVIKKRLHIKSIQAQEVKNFKESNMIQDIDQAYQNELQQFNEYWNDKFAEFDREANQCELTSLKNNEEAVERYEEELNLIVPIRPKISTQHLAYKKILDELIKNNDFKEAHKVKLICENMKMEEMERAKFEKQNRISGMVSMFAQQKKKEFEVLKQKIKKARNELAKRKRQETEQLSQKYLNLKKEKSIMHQLELSKFDLAHRYYVPDPPLSSPYNSKIGLRKASFYEERQSNLLNTSGNKKALNRSFEDKTFKRRMSNASPKNSNFSPLSHSFLGKSNLLKASPKAKIGSHKGLGGGATGSIALQKNSFSGSEMKNPQLTPLKKTTKKIMTPKRPLSVPNKKTRL